MVKCPRCGKRTKNIHMGGSVYVRKCNSCGWNNLRGPEKIGFPLVKGV